jgi:hypothetical protein
MAFSSRYFLTNKWPIYTGQPIFVTLITVLMKKLGNLQHCDSQDIPSLISELCPGISNRTLLIPFFDVDPGFVQEKLKIDNILLLLIIVHFAFF